MFSLLVRLAWEDQMKKEKNTTPSGEDYLEAILILQRQKGLVRPVDIARYMEFSKPSITHAISGGQRQRVWIAMALAQKTDMLFLDEPTTFLDIAHQLDIMQLLVQLNREQGVTIVMVSHDLNHAAMFSDYVVAVRNGIKEFEGTPQQVITPEVLRIVFDVESVPFSHPVFHTQLCLPYDLCRHPSKDTL